MDDEFRRARRFVKTWAGGGERRVRVAKLRERTVIAVEGEDAIEFLNDLTTNDLTRTVAQGAQTTAFLTAQGLLQQVCIAVRSARGVLLECDRALLNPFAEMLWKARLERAVSFRWLGELGVVSLFPDQTQQKDTDAPALLALGEGGGAACDGLQEGECLFKDPRKPLNALRLWHRKAEGIVKACKLPWDNKDKDKDNVHDKDKDNVHDDEIYEAYRLSLGIVERADDWQGVTKPLPFAFGLDALGAMDWDKACYVGQEITARMKYRARVPKKHALPVRLQGRATRVRAGDKVFLERQGGGDLGSGERKQEEDRLCGEVLCIALEEHQTILLALLNLTPLQVLLEGQGERNGRVSTAPLVAKKGLVLQDAAGTRLQAELLLPQWLAALWNKKDTHLGALEETGVESGRQGGAAVKGEQLKLDTKDEARKKTPQKNKRDDSDDVVRRSLAGWSLLAPIAISAVIFAAIVAWIPISAPTILALIPDAFAQSEVQGLKVQAPYRLSIFARVQGARSLAVAREIGVVFVSTRGKSLYAVHKGKSQALTNTLRVPNGIAWRAPYLYVVEQHRVSRHRFDKFNGRLPSGEVLFDGLPNKKHHGWRVAAIGADESLYVAVGAPCNICTLEGMQGTILRLPLAGGTPEIFARGVRNSVGLDFRPDTGVLFFTDNGADFMGDNTPLEELNRAPRKGMFFGFPFFGGATARTKEFRTRSLPQEPVFPVATFPAHNAPLGMHFYRGETLEDLKGDAFVALHGSWNRAIPDGYKVMRLHFERGKPAPIRQSVFIDGFLSLKGGRGRPVDVKTHWDGSILVSDDARGRVYQIR